MNTHHLKTVPVPFTAMWDGLKTFEIRRDDRNFQVGDELVLQIWDPFSKTYGRRTIEATVTYKTNDEKWGLLPGHCVLGLGNLRRILRAGPAESDTSPAPSAPSMGFSRMNYETFQKYRANLDPSRLQRVLDMYRGVASAAAGDSLSPKSSDLGPEFYERLVDGCVSDPPQPLGMGETMVRVTSCGDGPDTRRCTRWYEPKGTVAEMLEELARVAPTKTPYRAWLKGNNLSREAMTPLEDDYSLEILRGRTVLVYAEGREADRLAYSSPARQAQFAAANVCPHCHGLDPACDVVCRDKS